MNYKTVMHAATLLFVIATVAWFGMAYQEWSLMVAAITTAPLVGVFLLLFKRQPKVYFYAALLLMMYIATAMTQIMISPADSYLAIICLASALLYLMMLKFTLRALHALQSLQR